MKLIVYTLQNCYICNELKGRLNQLDIPFDNIIIDDGSKINSMIGNRIEYRYKTITYPILELYREYENDPSFVFVSKTDLEEQDKLHIFNDIEEITTKLKQIYAL